jgi:hypothetical protein
MYYHFAILLLFRPLIKLRILGSKISPRDVCSQAADAIQGLLRSYSQLYTLRRTPSFVPYFVLTSSIIHLAIGASSQTEESQNDTASVGGIKIAPRVAESIAQGIADLTEMAPCHHFAEQALNILRHLAKKWNIEIEIHAGKETLTDYDRLLRPYTSSLNFFTPDFREEDFLCTWGSSAATGASTLGGSTGPVAQAVASMKNPLFWPFPMQGRPMLPTGQQLREAGFALL